MKIINLVFSLINLAVMVVVVLWVYDNCVHPNGKMTVNELTAKRIFLSDFEGNGYILLSVDGNGPLIQTTQGNGSTASLGAVRLKNGVSIARTKYPAFSIAFKDETPVWIVPELSPGEETLRPEVNFGTADERIEQLLEEMESLSK